jgi:hypothetical protein
MGWDETRYVTGKGVVDTGWVELCGESQKNAHSYFGWMLEEYRIA